MTDTPTPKPRTRRLKAAGIAFTPVRTLRKRHDGWTPARQRDFLAALYACGIVVTAARSVGMSAKSAYRLRARPGAESFAAAWDRLLREATARALDMATEAALTESFVPRSHRGLVTGFVGTSNDRMLLAVLRATGRCRPPDARDSQLLVDFLSGKGHP